MSIKKLKNKYITDFDDINDINCINSSIKSDDPKNLNELLVKYCRYGDINMVKYILEKGYYDLSYNNCEAFIASCYSTEIDLVSYLLLNDKDNKINISANNDKAFQNACYTGSFEIVNLLLEQSNTIDITLFKVIL